MATLFNIGDVCKTTLDPESSYKELTEGTLVVIKERFGWSSEENGYCYLAYDGVRSYVLHSNQMVIVVSITSEAPVAV